MLKIWAFFEKNFFFNYKNIKNLGVFLKKKFFLIIKMLKICRFFENIFFNYKKC